jgi:hypothetical protein
LLRSDLDMTRVYYCYICECSRKSQDLPVLKGNSTAIAHMMAHGYIKDGNKKMAAPLQGRQGTIEGRFDAYKHVSNDRYTRFKWLLIR